MAINNPIRPLLVRLLFEGVNNYVWSSTERFTHVRDAKPVPIWIAILLSVTVWIVVVISSSVSYTLGHVVHTITIVEAPAKPVVSNDPRHDRENDKRPKGQLVPAGTAEPPKFITSHVHTSFRHLWATCGVWSQWRGVRFAILYHVLEKAVRNMITSATGQVQTPCEPFGCIPFVFAVMAATATRIIMAPVHMAWTHATIMMPSNMGLLSRLPSSRQWKTLLLPTAVLATTEVLGQQIVLCGRQYFGESTSMVGRQTLPTASAHVTVIGAALACSLFIYLPAEVVLARVEATMLPGGGSAVVPVDQLAAYNAARSTAVNTFCSAWLSFRRESIWRLARPTIALFALQATIVLLGGHAIALEIFATMGFGGFEAVARFLVDLEVRAAMAKGNIALLIRDTVGLACSGLQVID